MTVSSTTRRWDATGNGVTTAFAYDTIIYASTELEVYLAGVLQSTGYTVSNVGVEGGGNVTFSTAPASGVAVTLLKKIAAQQPNDLEPLGSLPVEPLERQVDRLTWVCIQILADLERTLRQPVGDTTDITALPALADRLGKLLRFNSSTGDPEAVAAADVDLVTFTAIGEAIANAASYAAVRALLDLEPGVDYQVYDPDTLKADTTDELTAGFTTTSNALGVISSGTTNLAFATKNWWDLTNNGASEIVMPTTGYGTMVVDITNGASAGSLTLTGATKESGVTLTTTNADKFRLWIARGPAGVTLYKEALQ